MNNIGKNIRIKRKAAGLTQKRLSEKSGVATITIQQYEAGKRHPRIEQLQLIADALDTTLDELTGLKQMPFKDEKIYFDTLLETTITSDYLNHSLEYYIFNTILNGFGYLIYADKNLVKESGELELKLYSAREDSYYSISSDQLKFLQESIISYIKFQINQFLSNTNEIPIELISPDERNKTKQFKYKIIEE